MRGDWIGGAMVYGPNIGSVWHAAQRLLVGTPPPPPPPTPPPAPAPPHRPPNYPLPTGCNVTAKWAFYSASAHATEVNGFEEAADGSLVLTPGHNDGWRTATGWVASKPDGTPMGEWMVQFFYGAGPRPAAVTCALAPNCSFITCPEYTYSRMK
jgi:hypothetical protein